MPGVDRLVAPVLVMRLVEAEQLNPALVDVVLQYLVHPPVRPLRVGPHAGRERQHPGTGVADHLQGHLAARALGECQVWISWFKRVLGRESWVLGQRL